MLAMLPSICVARNPNLVSPTGSPRGPVVLPADLNIWLPKNAGKAKKQYPMMLFFHGGSYETGSAM